jgi:flavin-dependent thymidylate synthase
MYQVQLATWTDKVILDVTFEEKEAKVKQALTRRVGTPLLESLCLTFALQNVPRSLTHQIVRARKLGFGQQAMRVNDVRHQPVRLPTTIEGSEFEEPYKELVGAIKRFYARMIDHGIPVEDARNIMPMGTMTYITVTGQLRFWLELWQGRAQKAAQNEYRVLVHKMLDEFSVRMPRLFSLLVTSNSIPTKVWLDDLSQADRVRMGLGTPE